jgi:hypothetical protein
MTFLFHHHVVFQIGGVSHFAQTPSKLSTITGPARNSRCPRFSVLLQKSTGQSRISQPISRQKFIAIPRHLFRHICDTFSADPIALHAGTASTVTPAEIECLFRSPNLSYVSARCRFFHFTCCDSDLNSPFTERLTVFVSEANS